MSLVVVVAAKLMAACWQVLSDAYTLHFLFFLRGQFSASLCLGEANYNYFNGILLKIPNDTCHI